MSLHKITVLLQIVHVANFVQKLFFPLGRKLVQDEGCVILNNAITDLQVYNTCSNAFEVGPDFKRQPADAISTVHSGIMYLSH